MRSSKIEMTFVAKFLVVSGSHEEFFATPLVQGDRMSFIPVYLPPTR